MFLVFGLFNLSFSEQPAERQESTARREENMLYKVPLGVLSVYKVISYLGYVSCCFFLKWIDSTMGFTNAPPIYIRGIREYDWNFHALNKQMARLLAGRSFLLHELFEAWLISFGTPVVFRQMTR